MKQSDKQRIAKIIEYADKLELYIKDADIDKNRLMNDYTAQWTVTTPLYNIGEHVYLPLFITDIKKIYASMK